MILWEGVLGGQAAKRLCFLHGFKISRFMLACHFDMVHAFTLPIVGVFLCVTPIKLLISLEVAG